MIAALSRPLRRRLGAGLLALATLLPAAPLWAESSAPAVELPARLFSLSHPVGQQRLMGSDYSQAYWPLASHFETQLNQAYCSVATSVVALNALGIPRPATPLYPDYPYFTQAGFFERVDPAVASPEGVSREGMTLEQLGRALAGYPVQVDVYPAGDLSLDEFRGLLMDKLRYDSAFVLLNFNRSELGLNGGGHWSPLAAYHPGSDSALILDVARYRYPPLWVPVEDLYRAAQSVDSVSQKSRGVLVVGRRL